MGADLGGFLGSTPPTAAHTSRPGPHRRDLAEARGGSGKPVPGRSISCPEYSLLARNEPSRIDPEAVFSWSGSHDHGPESNIARGSNARPSPYMAYATMTPFDATAPVILE